MGWKGGEIVYDEKLADWVEKLIGRRRGGATKRLLGGVTLLLSGNMACGVADDRVLLRLGEEGASSALE